MSRVGDEEREKIVSLLREHGGNRSKVAKIAGRGKATVQRVAEAAGIESERSATEKASVARSLFAEIDRKEVIAEMLQKGRDILDATTEARGYKDAVTGLGISIDKHLLVSGEATARTENVDAEARRRVREGLDDLARRRRMAGRS